MQISGEGVLEVIERRKTQFSFEPDDVAVISGGSRGIGKAIVLALACHGIPVGVMAWDDEEGFGYLKEELDALGTTYVLVNADVSNWDAVQSAVTRISHQLGHPTLLVNNAGIMTERGWDDLTVDEWQKTLAVNLSGPFFLTKAVVSSMRKAKSQGRIVNISSQTALTGHPLLTDYVASKAGVLGLTRASARALAPRIRVNAVAPGPVETDLIKPLATEQWVKERVRNLALSRLGSPPDISTAVLYLLSTASGWVTGQTLHINGGGFLG